MFSRLWSFIMAPGVAVREQFEILSGLVVYSSYQIKATTRIKSYPRLPRYVKEVSSAWTEVWTIAWPSRAPIMALGS